MTNKERAKRYRQKMLNRKFTRFIVINLLIIFTILFVFTIKSAELSENNKNEDESNFIVYESNLSDHVTVTSSANASAAVALLLDTSTTSAKFDRNLSQNDKYLLAKMAMAEAEGESLETKVNVILTILNRVKSDDEYFPDTIEEVIFQNDEGVYQFSPVMPGGRWWSIEPNEECWKAVEIVNATEEDISKGALYFEACEDEDNWHSKNLEFIRKLDNTRFYK